MKVINHKTHGEFKHAAGIRKIHENKRAFSFRVMEGNQVKEFHVYTKPKVEVPEGYHWRMQPVESDVHLKAKHLMTDGTFIAEVWKSSFDDDWQYDIRFCDQELNNKEICCSRQRYPRGQQLNTLGEAKAHVEKLFPLLHKGMKPPFIWIFKGIMIGFTEESQMQHLQEKTAI